MTDNTKALLLDIVSYRLFGAEKPEINNADIVKLLKEAYSQTVYTMVFPFVEEKLKSFAPEKFDALSEKYLAKLIVNTGNFHDHGELDRIMTENNIPYAVIKGIASAYYYPDSNMRDMGDVDFLVKEEDFEKTEALVQKLGYKYDHGESGDVHVAYERPGLSILEIHRSVNGIPKNAKGALIKNEIEKAVPTSRRIEFASASCNIVSEYLHGLIMLLHMVSHMTKEGIGLRHLCDWAVFVNSFTDERFREIFEAKLKSFGLWKFCCIITKTCMEYLKIDEKDFVYEVEIESGLTEAVLDDILGGGNFGKKDMNRYREIKYISDRGGNSVSDKGIVAQLFSSLNEKTKSNKLVKKNRIFYPIGLAGESFKYAGLVLSGKRKSSGTSEMLKEASKRKNLYNELGLFKK